MECINNISNMDDMEILTSIKEEILDLLEGNADGLDVLYQRTGVTCNNLEQYLEFTVGEFKHKQTQMETLASHALKLMDFTLGVVEEKHQLQSDIENMESILEKKDNIIEELESKVQSLEKANKDYKNYFIEYQNQLQNQQQQAHTLEHMVNQIQGINQEEIQNKNDQVQELREEVKELTEDVERNLGIINEMEQTIETIKMENILLRQNIDNLLKENEELEEQQEQFAHSLTRLESENNQILEELRDIKYLRQTVQQNRSIVCIGSQKQNFFSTMPSEKSHYNKENSKEYMMEKSLSHSEKDIYNIKSVESFGSMSSLLNQPHFLRNILPQDLTNIQIEMKSIGVTADLLSQIPEVLQSLKFHESRPSFGSQTGQSNVTQSNRSVQKLKKKCKNQIILHKTFNRNHSEYKQKINFLMETLTPFFIKGYLDLQNYFLIFYDQMFVKVVRNRIKK